MKKFITLSAILALTVATVADARGGRSGGSRSFSSSRAVATKPVMTQQQANSYAKQNTQKDATFENTPNRTIPNQTQTQSTGSNRLASFATGAAAGYVLSEMLTPTAAQAAPAQTNATETTSEPAPQAVENTQNLANTAAPAATVAQFKSIGGQVDPFLIEKTDGYRRYCIAGVQYLAAAMTGQSAPIVMVNPNGSPLACNLIP